MFVMALNGPSVTAESIPHAGWGPPWWHPMHLGNSAILLSLWAAAVIATAGVVLGLVAVGKGARPSIRLMVGTALGVTVVFAVLIPAGSTDAISYAIDGAMTATGHSPYVMEPAQFVKEGGTIGRYSSVTWRSTLSDYGPLATASEWLAVKLSGGSQHAVLTGARVATMTFWIKVWAALSFGAIVLLLDWLLRADDIMRRRAHLLWSLNPLLIWEIVGAGHIDGVAVAFGLAGIGLLWTRRPGTPEDAPAQTIGLTRAVIAGALIGAAIAVKIPFAVYAVAAAWMLRHQIRQLVAVAIGALIVVIPSYGLAGTASIKVLFTRGNQNPTWDNLYNIFYRPFNVNTTSTPKDLNDIAIVLMLGLVVMLLWRLPQRTPRWPAVPVAMALSMAWLFVWPFQRPWYDVMLIGLLVLYPASRLDWVVLGRLGFAAITYMDAVTIVPQNGRLALLQFHEGWWITPAARVVAVIWLIWLCITGRWGWRPGPTETPTSAPDLQGVAKLSTATSLWTSLWISIVENLVVNFTANPQVALICPPVPCAMDDEQTELIEVPERHRRHVRPMVLAGIAALAVAVGAGGAYAATNHSPTPATTSAYTGTATPTSSAPAATPARPHRFGWGVRTGFGRLGLGVGAGTLEHGTVTIRKKNGTDETVDVQRGTVTAVSSTSITIKSTDGFTASYAVSSDTVVDAESAGIGSVKTGDNVYVTATASGSTSTAMDIMDATAVKNGRAHFATPSS
jgi:hypothetical protein